MAITIHKLSTCIALALAAQGCSAFVITHNGVPISGPAADTGEEIVIKPSALVQPERRVLNLKNGDRHMGDVFPGCGGSYTTDGPALRFTLTEPAEDLRLLVDGSSAVLVPPGLMSGALCLKGGLKLDKWEAGTYKLFLHGPSVGLSAKVQIDAPARLLAEATRAAQSAPLVPDAEPARNPLWHQLPAPAMVVDWDVSGLSCARDGQLGPVARIDVATPSTYTIAAGRRIRVADMSGRCLSEDGKRVELAAGQYVVWGVIGAQQEAAASWEVEVFDERRAMAFAPVERVKLGALAEPLAIPVRGAPLAKQPSAQGACSRGSREPSFLLELDQPLSHMELGPLRGQGLRYNVYGPLEALKPGQPMRCGLNELNLTDAAGTYAVWVYEQEGAPVEGFVVASRPEVEPAPMYTPIPIPESLPLEQRLVRLHYPYHRGSFEPLFLGAPDVMFVYATSATGAVMKDEPLLLLSHEATKATVARFDGATVKVNPAQLTTTRPEQVALPAQADKPKAAEGVSQALQLAGSAEDAYTKAYLAKRDKFDKCVYAYMAKHDPSWNKSYELIYVRSGRNVKDVMYERADRACGAGGLASAGKTYTKQVNDSRLKSVQQYLARVKTRFNAP